MSDSEDEFEDAKAFPVPVTLDQLEVKTVNLFYKEHLKLKTLKNNFVTPLSQNDSHNQQILKKVNDLWKEHESLEIKASKLSSTMQQWKSYKRYTFDMRKKLKEKTLSEEEVKKDLAKYFVELSAIDVLKKNLFKNWYQDFRITKITNQRKQEIIWKDKFDVIEFLEKEYVVAATKVKTMRKKVVQINQKIHELKKRKYEEMEQYNDRGNELARCKAKVRIVEDKLKQIKVSDGTPVLQLYTMYQTSVAEKILNVNNITWGLLNEAEKAQYVQDARNKYDLFFQYVVENHSNPRIVLYHGYQKNMKGMLKQLIGLYNNVHMWDFESLDMKDDNRKFVTLAFYFFMNKQNFISRDMMKMKLIFFLLRLSNFYKEERFLNSVKDTKLRFLTVESILKSIFSQLNEHDDIKTLAEHMTWYYDEDGEILSNDKKEFIFAGFIDRYFSNKENDLLFQMIRNEKSDKSVNNFKF